MKRIDVGSQVMPTQKGTEEHRLQFNNRGIVICFGVDDSYVKVRWEHLKGDYYYHISCIEPAFDQ